MEDRSFYSVLGELCDKINHGGMIPKSYYADALTALREEHEKEMAEAARAFMEDYWGDEGPHDFEADAISIIKEHARDCDRADLRRRVTEYYEHPGTTIGYGDNEYEVGAISYMDVLGIIMHPNTSWTSTGFYHRLMYLLGDDLEGE